MASVVTCPQCQTRLLLDSATSAPRVRCPRCKTVVETGGSAKAQGVSAPPGPRPAMPPPAPPAAAAPDDPRRSAPAEDESPRPARCKRRRRRIRYEEDEPKSKKPPWFYALAAAGVLMLFVFGGVTFFVLARMNMLPDPIDLLIGLVIMVPVSCVILVVSMVISSAIAGGIDFGVAHWAILKALLLLMVVNFVGTIPYAGFFLTLPIWVFGLMVLFDLDFWETRFLVVVNWVLNAGFRWLLLAALVAAITHGGGGVDLADLDMDAPMSEATQRRLQEMREKAAEELEKQLELEDKILTKFESLGAKCLEDPNEEEPGIVYVSLSNSRVTDADLVDLKHLRNLRDLELGHSLITDKGLAHVKESKSLRRLWARNSRLTVAGIKDLQQASPALVINR